MVGTQRTPVRVSSTRFPLSSRADTHMSPIATQRCGAPSTPRTDVPQGTALSKSVSQGLREWCPAVRALRVVIKALAEEATRRSTGEASGQSDGWVDWT
eukprot:3393983-Pleurochrysis_carterae.AAC.1